MIMVLVMTVVVTMPAPVMFAVKIVVPIIRMIMVIVVRIRIVIVARIRIVPTIISRGILAVDPHRSSSVSGTFTTRDNGQQHN
jgi:hypothetical protein